MIKIDLNKRPKQNLLSLSHVLWQYIILVAVLDKLWYVMSLCYLILTVLISPSLLVLSALMTFFHSCCSRQHYLACLLWLNRASLNTDCITERNLCLIIMGKCERGVCAVDWFSATSSYFEIIKYTVQSKVWTHILITYYYHIAYFRVIMNSLKMWNNTNGRMGNCNAIANGKYSDQKSIYCLFLKLF